MYFVINQALNVTAMNKEANTTKQLVLNACMDYIQELQSVLKAQNSTTDDDDASIIWEIIDTTSST